MAAQRLVLALLVALGPLVLSTKWHFSRLTQVASPITAVNRHESKNTAVITSWCLHQCRAWATYTQRELGCGFSEAGGLELEKWGDT